MIKDILWQPSFCKQSVCSSARPLSVTFINNNNSGRRVCWCGQHISVCSRWHSAANDESRRDEKDEAKRLNINLLLGPIAEQRSSNFARRTFVDHSREMFAFQLFAEGTRMGSINFQSSETCPRVFCWQMRNHFMAANSSKNDRKSDGYKDGQHLRS